jgi:hypothetical protein
LNQEGIVQIGDVLFKVDTKDQEVWTMKSSDKALHYNDFINENESVAEVKKFSTEQDIFLMLQMGIDPKNPNIPELGCDEKGGQDRTIPSFTRHHVCVVVKIDSLGNEVSHREDYQTYMQHKYVRLGIYYCIVSHIKYRKRDIPSLLPFLPFDTDLSIAGEFSFKPRCKPLVVGTFGNSTFFTNEVREVPYRGTRKLNTASVTSRYTWRENAICNTTNTFTHQLPDLIVTP